MENEKFYIDMENCSFTAWNKVFVLTNECTAKTFGGQVYGTVILWEQTKICFFAIWVDFFKYFFQTFYCNSIEVGIASLLRYIKYVLTFYDFYYIMCFKTCSIINTYKVEHFLSCSQKDADILYFFHGNDESDLAKDR